MTGRPHSWYEHARDLRDSNSALVVAFLLASVGSIPSASTAVRGFHGADPGAWTTVAWSIAAAVLAGHLVVQFLAGVATADEYVDNPDSRYGWGFAYFRAVAIRPFVTLVSSVWLFALAVLAPYARVPTAPAVVVGFVAFSAFAAVVSQPHAGPTLGE